eukprot:gnl/Chilomastix_cuspidata/4112.p1 GENE.gnl/Chilomastix_cuspidata/4112~~gnl/Chilomastix_cuspidata/4112.p1  ORF type:complete len:552 (-),score=191.25 gnl/Chilomastix_cuspidata/4112:1-1656(-)
MIALREFCISELSLASGKGEKGDNIRGKFVCKEGKESLPACEIILKPVPTGQQPPTAAPKSIHFVPVWGITRLSNLAFLIEPFFKATPLPEFLAQKRHVPCALKLSVVRAVLAALAAFGLTPPPVISARDILITSGGVPLVANYLTNDQDPDPRKTFIQLLNNFIPPAAPPDTWAPPPFFRRFRSQVTQTHRFCAAALLSAFEASAPWEELGASVREASALRRRVEALEAHVAALERPRVPRSRRSASQHSSSNSADGEGSPVFSAFDGAHKLRFVAAAAAQPVMRLGAVSVSNPVDTGISISGLTYVSAAVAADGTFVWCDLARRCLCLVNLVDGRRACIEGFATNAAVATYGSTVAVFVWKSAELLHAPTSRLFTRQCVEAFERTRIPTVGFHTACADVARTTGRVFYRGPGWDLVEVDLATLRATVHTELPKVSRVVAMTSVHVDGVLCVAEVDGALMALLADGSTRVLAENGKSPICFFPSAADPAALKRGAWLDFQRNLHVGGASYPFSAPVRPAVTQGLVRIWNDVFLCIDELSQRVAAVRIAVP